ncbi:hypothetical protein [Azospirillum rugosum]|uniref:Uncharacterized protein n=1 Tax=Azospirillum rugosum TaxID=416170 RepID=A0ABS4SEQ4_9PROT|nr:hypothetical protein [Azospirillum rugosum]MBP2291066.1 hypothetical protein [Azospirillum rugosum]MDQ0524870.1 hypothetical protein [Azospirillum rugosum]
MQEFDRTTLEAVPASDAKWGRDADGVSARTGRIANVWAHRRNSESLARLEADGLVVAELVGGVQHWRRTPRGDAASPVNR